MLPTHTVTTSAAPNRPETLVLDTNTALDWLVFSDAAARVVGAAIVGGRLRWLATPRMLGELGAVLRKPLAQRWETARALASTIDFTTLATMCTEPAVGQYLICRDTTDQVFVDLAREHRPALLLTRDRALLALRGRARADGVQIATAVAWLNGQSGTQSLHPAGPRCDLPRPRGQPYTPR